MSKSIAHISCSCTGQAAQFQDNKYGKNIRVANVATKTDVPSSSSVQVSCTVCGSKHTVSKSTLH
jgi:hypothetical protein